MIAVIQVAFIVLTAKYLIWEQFLTHVRRWFFTIKNLHLRWHTVSLDLSLLHLFILFLYPLLSLGIRRTFRLKYFYLNLRVDFLLALEIILIFIGISIFVLAKTFSANTPASFEKTSIFGPLEHWSPHDLIFLEDGRVLRTVAHKCFPWGVPLTATRRWVLFRNWFPTARLFETPNHTASSGCERARSGACLCVARRLRSLSKARAVAGDYSSGSVTIWGRHPLLGMKVLMDRVLLVGLALVEVVMLTHLVKRALIRVQICMLIHNLNISKL